MSDEATPNTSRDGENVHRVEASAAWRLIADAPFVRNRYGPESHQTTLELNDWCLLARRDEHGWVIWVGTLDAGEWIGRDEGRGCWECEAPPTHFMPLPSPPR